MRLALVSLVLPLVLGAPALAAPARVSSDRAWALAVAPGGREVVEPSLPIARPGWELRAGDALEYALDARAIDAEGAGVVLVLASGAREPAPARVEPIGHAGHAGHAGWRTVRVELGARAGDRVDRVELAARGLAPGPGLVRVRDVRLVRASGDPIELAPPAGAPLVLADDPLAHACATTADATDVPVLWASAAPDAVRDPWLAVDLATLRAREARASEIPAAAIDERAPRGLVWAGDGVPLAFAAAGEPRSVFLRGQRLAIEPLDGGTTYALHLALAVPAGDALRTTWRVVGSSGEQRDVVVELPARDAEGRYVLEPEHGFLGAGFVVLDVPVASAFPVAAIELPREPAAARVELLAASVEWRRDAAADARFRRAWMARERPSEGLARYLRNLRSSAAPAGEDEHERRMFRALVDGDLAAFDAELVLRVAAVRSAAKDARDGRIALYGVAAPYDPSIDDDAARAAAIERERDRCAVLGRFASLRTTAPDARTLRRLERAAPDVANRLGELARAGRIELGPAAWTHGAWGALGEEALARELAWGMEAVRSSLGADARIGWLPADLGWFRQLPQLAGALGLDALVGAPVDWSASPRPLVFELQAPDGTAMTCFVPPRVRAASRDLLALEPMQELLALAKGRNGVAELCLPLVVAGTSDAVQRENRKRMRELVLADVGPRARQTTLGEFLKGVRGEPERAVPAWRARKEGAAAEEIHARSDALRAWIRRAETALVDAQVATALAAADGLVPLRERERELWERVLDAHEAAARPGAHPEHLASAREVVAAAETLGAEALGVLARSADTRGAGSALFVFNTVAWERTEVVVVDADVGRVVDAKGRGVATQAAYDGGRVFEAEVPSLGYAVHRVVEGEEQGVRASPLVVDGWRVSNGACVVEVDPATGEIASLRRVGCDELLARATRLERVASDGTVDVGEMVRVEMVERGPVRAAVRVVREFAGVVVEQVTSLAAHAERVDVVTRVPEGFDGSLRVVFGVVDPRDAALRHVPFGYGAVVEREELERSAFGRWVSQGTDRGVGLASVDAAACASAKGELALWLRDPEADGVARARTVRWSVVPFEGPEHEAGVMQRGFEVAHPVRAVVEGAHAGFRGARHAFVEVVRVTAEGGVVRGVGAGVVVSGLSAPEEGAGFVMRLFDVSGRGGEVVVELDRPQFGVRRVDLVGRTMGMVKAEAKRVRWRVDPWRVETLVWSWRP